MSARHARRRVFLGGAFSPARWYVRLTAGVAATAIVAAGLVVGVSLTPAAAAIPITLTSDTGGSILAGDNAEVTLTASNDSTDTNLYNLSFRYELPVGVTYRAGSTLPQDAGEPTIITIVDNAPTLPAITHQVLVWRNTSDLPIGQDASLTFSLVVDPAIYPVGSKIVATQAGTYGQVDPRMIPRFDPTTGAPIPSSISASDVETPQATAVAAIKLSKSEPSPESELMRGVHDQTTTYTLTVETSDQGGNENLVVVDYLPAGLEFLGCGGADNSTPGTEEYPNSGRLTSTPAPDGTCPVPFSVTTVQNPTPALSGVFTRVEWRLGTVPAGQPVSINYRAAIPLHANTMSWSGAQPGPDGAQGSNLDNNSGASTRQDGVATTLTNSAVATSTYLGTVFAGTTSAQKSEASHSVKSSDVSIVKSTSTPSFTSGGIAEYRLDLRVSEYTDASSLVITDVFPDGLCPLVPAGTVVEGNQPTDCRVNAPVTGATVQKVVAEADGTFTVTMIPDAGAIDANGVLTITYGALMRANYQGSSSAPTVAGDSFVNTVSLTGETADSPLSPGTPSTVTVTDDSHASIGSLPPSISKKVLPRPATTGETVCADHAGEYVSATGAALPIYQLGDRICFELTVNFSKSTMTRNAEIQDFVPTGTTYEGYAVNESAANALPASQVVQSTTGNAPVFQLGARDAAAPADTSLYVDKGRVLTLYVWAIVGAPASSSSAPDITANLMKYRQQSTANTVLSLRDQADFAIAPSAQAAIAKTITSVNGAAPLPSNENALVREGNAVGFALAVSNPGTAAVGNNFPIKSITVWDALPQGFTCASVSAISDAGVCTNPGASTHPVFGDNGVRSAIVWTLAGPIAPGATHAPVTYTVTVPNGLSVSQSFINDTSVVSFTSANTKGGDTSYYPRNSLDGTNSSRWNSPAANDSAAVKLPDATVAKTATPNIPGLNKKSNEVVAGETVKYTYSVTVPAGSTVFNGVLKDSLPPGLEVAPGAVVKATILGTTYTLGDTLPTGFALDAAGTLTFPATHDNTTSAPQVFSVTIESVLVTNGRGSFVVGSNVSNVNLRNTAQFTSKATLGGTAVPQRTAAATVTVVTPVPTLTKTVDKTGFVTSGTALTYTLVAGNTSGKPTAYDGVITDCLPAGLTFLNFVSAPAGTTTSSVPSPASGCAEGETKLTWTLPADYGLVTTSQAATTKTATLVFRAEVGSFAAGLVTYPNTATLVSSTLNNGSNTAAVERVMTTTSTAANVTVAGASTVKTLVSPASGKATIGETVRYRVSVTLPANVNFFQSAIIDQLPASGNTLLVTPNMSSATFTCVAASPAVTADCMGDLQSGGPTALTASTNQIGWLLGNVAKTSWERTVTVEYDATVRDVTENARAATRSNSALLKWKDTAGASTPTSAGDAFPRSGTAGTATFTVIEPRLSIQKDVSDATPEPGDVFTYTVAVTNAYDVNGSTAHAVRIVDTVPTGVVVDPATISGNGTLSGSTITWTVPTIANTTPATVVTFTYDATLAASSTLTTATLTNTAQVTSYESLATGGRVYTTNPPTDTAAVTPAFPAIVLSKAVVGPNLAYVGDPLAWTLTLRNGGTGMASTVIPTDQLPANWVYDGNATLTRSGSTASFAPRSETILSGVQTLVWPAVLNLAPGESIVINYTATPQTAALTTPGVGASVQHVNTLSAVATDATGATGHAGLPTPVPYGGTNATASAHIDSADVSIVKSPGGGLVAGTTTANAWTIAVRNGGPDTAVGPFTITDTPALPIPSGVTFVAATGTGWTCGVPDSSTGAFTCARTNANDTLAAGSSFPVINVAVAVAADVTSGTSITNRATVSAKTHDPVAGNNSSAATVSLVTTSADLTILKEAAGPFIAGQQATWTIGVSNAGPSIARYPITVTDTLPTAGIDVESVHVDGGPLWACVDPEADDTTFTCAYNGTGGSDAGLGIAAAPLITVTANIDSSFTGSLTNTATVTSATPDPTPNTSTVTTPVSTSTVLTISKTLNDKPLVPGATARYTLVVTNTGTPDAPTVVVSDPLPNGLVFQSGTSLSGDWTCEDTGTAEASVATCTLANPLPGAGTLPAGSNVASFDLVVTVPAGLTGAVLNTATVTWDGGTNTGSDNSALVGKADLEILKSHPTGPVYAGTSLTYTLTVQNLGPSDSPEGIVVTDTVPTGLTPTSADGGDAWDCSVEGQIVTCTSLEEMLAGSPKQSIEVVASIPATAGAATYVNQATVAGPLTDPVETNNVAYDPTVVTRFADVTIDKSVVGTTWTAGTEITYTLTVTNAGPSIATLLTVTDVLPEGFTNLRMSSTDTNTVWTCGAVACTTPTMAVGTSTITVTADVAASIPTGSERINTANVNWTDSRGAHDENDTATVEVVAVAALALEKTPDTQTVDAGANATFSLDVSNAGPSDAVGPIVIVDTLPVGIRYVSANSAWNCVPDTVADTEAQPVTCTLGDGTVGIANGGAALTLTMVTSTDPALGPVTLTNTAAATSPTDPDGATDTATVTFTQSADLSIVKSHNAGSVRIGDDLAFGFTIANAGPSVASGITVVDTLPAELTYAGFVGSDPAWTCSAEVEESGETTVTCVLDATVAPAATVPPLVVSATVTAAAYSQVVNTATIGAETPDPNTENNTSIDPVVVPPLVWLYVEKQHVGEVRIGERATYVITVGNKGETVDPGGFTIVDSLPVGLSYESFTGTDVDCVADGSEVTCTFDGPLEVGAERDVTLIVRVLPSAPAEIVNTVVAASLYEQISEEDLTATDTATVLAAHPLPLTGMAYNALFMSILSVFALLIGAVLWIVSRLRRERLTA